MSDETKLTEAEANIEEQPADEAPAQEEAPVLEASAAEGEPQAVAEPVAEAVSEPEAEAATEPVAEAVAEPEVEAASEPVAEAAAVPEAEPVAEAVAEPAAEAVAEPEAEAVAEPVVEAAVESASAESDEGGRQREQQAPTLNRVEGPAIFNRAKQGNQRRNPRHVGNDVRIDEIDYKNVQILSRFVDNYGRIHNRRKTRVTAKLQRKVTRAIKRARHLALMPYTGEHMRITGRRG